VTTSNVVSVRLLAGETPLAVACPECKAAAGELCAGAILGVLSHNERIRAAAEFYTLRGAAERHATTTGARS
jgi:hypothetical protein